MNGEESIILKDEFVTALSQSYLSYCKAGVALLQSRWCSTAKSESTRWYVLMRIPMPRGTMPSQ